MANYLPVLLVSVAANSIPDDSSVSTLPRGQVDYLSHNWEEEDVWRSWRNMTRQKNEIANGVRLENASWRTWWKQRNGLGTVTPETLNWLKDSDVTWLYGPLHTAVDWTPPPKPIPDPATNRTSALDLSTTTHKPILKHRSISQLLTSDLPTTPLFSPTGSDEDEDYLSHPPIHLPDEPGGSSEKRPALTHTKSDTHITRWGPSRAFRKESPPRIDPPALPPGVGANAGTVGYTPTNLENYFSASNTSSDSNPTITNAQASGGQKKRHISFNTFVEQCIAIEKPKKGATIEYDDDDDDEEEEEDGEEGRAPRAVSGGYPQGRNVWGDDDGYEEDEEADSGDEDEEEAVSLTMWDERYGGCYAIGSDSDSLECEEEPTEHQLGEEEDSVIEMSSSTFCQRTKSPRSQSTFSSTSSSSSTSTSTSVSTGSTTSTSSSSEYNSQRKPSSRRLSTSTTSTYRPHFHTNPSVTSTSSKRRRRIAPPLIRTPTGSSEPRSAHSTSPQPQPTHVTIAPIAPTILKTGPNGYYGGAGGWLEGFGDEGGSDDGLWGGGGGSRWWNGNGSSGNGEKERKREDGTGSGGTSTPVELVYVPPLGSNYSVRTGRERDIEREQQILVREQERERSGDYVTGKGLLRTGGRQLQGDVMEDHEDGFGNGDQEVYRRRTAMFSVGDDDADDAVDVEEGVPFCDIHTGVPVPTVVVRRTAADSGLEQDVYHSLEGPNFGEDIPLRRSSSGRIGSKRSVEFGASEGARGRGSFSSGNGLLGDDRSRSRSMSRSRTPSPAIISPSTSLTTAASDRPVPSPNSKSATGRAPVPVPRKSASISPPSSSLLAPPPRGRGSTSQQDLQVHSRGRSSTRTASTSMSDRDRSLGHQSSSIGSLSPDGIDLACAAGAYAGGRMDKEVEREKRAVDRERSRGRDRSGTKRLSSSLSPDDMQDSLLRVSPASLILPPPSPSQLVSSSKTPRFNIATKSATSSSSSSSSSTSSSTTVVPSAYTPATSPNEAPAVFIPIAEVRRAEEEQRYLHPTPSNSPIIFMKMPTAPVVQPTSTTTTKVKSPLAVPAPHPAEPSTSYSISPPRGEQSTPSSPTSPKSPSSPTKGDATIVSKAVEIVSSAGAFLGFWHSGNT